MAHQPKDPSASRASATDKPVTERRGFFSKVAAIVVGGLIMVIPFSAGIATLLDPVMRRRRKGLEGAAAGSADDSSYVKLAELDAVPKDGMPARFQVIADRDDAWTRQPREPVGVVFLRRTDGAEALQAFTATCPHAGCFVGFNEKQEHFVCPCHNSAFDVDGSMIQPTPSPRPLDTLDYQIRQPASGEGPKEVWVKFENFYTGIEAKRAKA